MTSCLGRTEKRRNGWTVQWLKEDGRFVGQVVEMPAAISQGRTIRELVWVIHDAIAALQELDEE